MGVAKQYREMSDEQIALTLHEQERRLFELRFQAATDRLEAVAELKLVRRDIARLLTVQRERVLKVERDALLAPLRAMTDAELKAEAKRQHKEMAELKESNYRKKHAGRRHKRRINESIARIQGVMREKQGAK